MTTICYILFVIMLLLGAGCKPSVSVSGEEPSIRIHPDCVRMESSVSPLDITVLFSNSTSRMLVLAPDNIDLYGNLTFIAHHRLIEIGTNWEATGNDRLLINPKSLLTKPETIELAPGAVWERSVHLPFGVRFCGVPDTNTDSQIVAMFCGWNPKALRSYQIRDFPVKLRPYVWTNIVTSPPIPITFENALLFPKNRGTVRVKPEDSK